MDKEKTFLYVIIALCLLLLCSITATGVYKYKYDRLVAINRQQSELIRSRSEQYESIYRRARETNRELGECLSKSVATLSGLRLQISEVRSRYEKMEELLSGSIGDNNNIRYNNSSTSDSNGEINE